MQRKRQKQETTALYRVPAGPGAVILTTTDGTDPDGYIALDRARCKFVCSGSSLVFFGIAYCYSMSVNYLFTNVWYQ